MFAYNYLPLSNTHFLMTDYKLINVATGDVFEDTGWLLSDPAGKDDMIRSIYKEKQLRVKDDKCGLYKFSDWLPINHELAGSHAPVTYKSKGLAGFLGIENLYITFSGYNPNVGAQMTTCSFKETEAYSVGARLKANEDRVLVVSSAGNTARAFAKVFSDNNIKLLLCVPLDNIDALWFDKPLNDCVKLICTCEGSDYFDAIDLGNKVVKSAMFLAEGGAKNVARRDGMGTTVLSAATTIGQIPDYYFQAVGSGTGAIAAHEANLRLNEDGHYGNKMMKIVISQNSPFDIIHRSWQARSKAILPYAPDVARKHAKMILAKVLANRKPPYTSNGGLYDVLNATNGMSYAIDNDDVEKAVSLFEKHEGTDIYHAAGVATASLIKACEEGTIDKNKIVMLNITGGGERQIKNDRKIYFKKPDYVFKYDEQPDNILKVVENLFR